MDWKNTLELFFVSRDITTDFCEIKMRAEGFEPTHPKIPECFVMNPPKSGALNHSAKLP